MKPATITFLLLPCGKFQLDCKRCRRRFRIEPRRLMNWLATHMRGCTPPAPEKKPKPARAARYWTAEEDAVLLATPNNHVASERLGRTLYACRYRRTLLNRKKQS